MTAIWVKIQSWYRLIFWEWLVANTVVLNILTNWFSTFKNVEQKDRGRSLPKQRQRKCQTRSAQLMGGKTHTRFVLTKKMKPNQQTQKNSDCNTLI